MQRLAEALASPRSARRRLSVVVLDLDGFKNVNDTLGHGAGDELLQEAAAERLLGCVREGDIAARLGGDEFAVMIGSVGPGRRAGDRRPGSSTSCTSRSPSPARTSPSAPASASRTAAAPASAEELLLDADIAMYVAKRTGKGRLEVFEPEMRVKAAHRTRLQQELARAVERGEIEVAYQPVIDLGTRRPSIAGGAGPVAAPGRPAVPADVFIALAEESGAINKIGREVLRRPARRRNAGGQQPGNHDLGIAVNVSVHQVLAGHLADHVVEVLRETGLPPRG